MLCRRAAIVHRRFGAAYSSAAAAKQVEDVVFVGGGLVGATLAAAVGACVYANHTPNPIGIFK